MNRRLRSQVTTIMEREGLSVSRSGASTPPTEGGFIPSSSSALNLPLNTTSASANFPSSPSANQVSLVPPSVSSATSISNASSSNPLPTSSSFQYGAGSLIKDRGFVTERTPAAASSISSSTGMAHGATSSSYGAASLGLGSARRMSDSAALGMPFSSMAAPSLATVPSSEQSVAPSSTTGRKESVISLQQKPQLQAQSHIPQQQQLQSQPPQQQNGASVVASQLKGSNVLLGFEDIFSSLDAEDASFSFSSVRSTTHRGEDIAQP
jgi:hypothetical protein